MNKISARDFEIFDFIVSFGFALVESLRRFFRTKATAEGWLKRMRAAGLLRSDDFDGKRVYYRLTDKGVSLLKRHGHRTATRAASRSLRPLVKTHKYALLLFCTSPDSPSRVPYRPAKDAESFPTLALHLAENSDPLVKKHFYREGELIGQLVVDSGKPDFVDTLARETFAMAEKVPDFLALAKQGRFRLAIVCVAEQRRRNLVRQMQAEPISIPWEVLLYPDVAVTLPAPRRTSTSKLQLTLTNEDQ